MFSCICMYVMHNILLFKNCIGFLIYNFNIKLHFKLMNVVKLTAIETYLPNPEKHFSESDTSNRYSMRIADTEY
jgi:hypothetical protein